MALPEFNHLICIRRQRLRSELSPSVGTAPSQDERRFPLMALCPERKYEPRLEESVLYPAPAAALALVTWALLDGGRRGRGVPGVQMKEPVVVKWLEMEELDALWVETLASASLWRVAPWGSAGPNNDGKLPRAPQQTSRSCNLASVCATERSPWALQGSTQGVGVAGSWKTTHEIPW